MKPGKGNIETKVYSSASINSFIHCKKHIIFTRNHRMWYNFFGKGKNKVMKLFKNVLICSKWHKYFNRKTALQKPYTVIAHFFFSLYMVLQKPKKSIDNYRYLQSAKSTRLNVPVKLSSLPPTAAAAQQHLLRVYYQVQTWLGKNSDPCLLYTSRCV